MKQIIQDLKSGDTILEELPVPKIKSGHVLIKTHRSLVSLGTEKMLVNFGKANYLDKARQQPEKVKMVLDKIKADGLQPTLEAVFRKLGEPLPLGYCNAGEVIGVGKGVTHVKVGDRVVSNGNHAEVVNVPKNLVAKIPDGVSFEQASFTVIGAIALQGIRLVNPTFGETVVVTGLGLIGLIAAQLLRANGCKVVGLDFDQKKVDLAQSWGIESYNVGGADPVQIVEGLTNGNGADAVLITASTKSDEVIAQAAQMSRKRGRIVLVGVIGLDIKRSDFYEKELSFQVSCSYGPGRYDPYYEEKGNDYPLAYVRWTEQRNFEAILHAISIGTLKLDQLVTERVALDDFGAIYNNMNNPDSIASVIEYSGQVNLEDRSVEVLNKSYDASKPVLGIIGAGNFTNSTILPNLKKLSASIKYIVSSKGLSGKLSAKKFEIGAAATDDQIVFEDKEVNTVLVTTRHNLHAAQCIQALEKGKHVFVEKPLALSIEELDAVRSAYNESNGSVTVGFNRRFSPFIVDMKKQLKGANGAINVIATMNAGAIPLDHWTQDLEIGGGRIIGEACHYIDLISYLVDSEVEAVVMNAMGTDANEGTDNASLILRYKNGAQGIINYYSNGSKAYSKERVEVFSGGKTLIMDNFRKSTYFGCNSKGMKSSQNKGHFDQFKQFLLAIEAGKELIPFKSIYNTSKTAILAIESLKKGEWIHVD
jgi:predicted dehydrogenase/threonine dehydrogenase-like Zn-dependent dehydrogenase